LARCADHRLRKTERFESRQDQYGRSAPSHIVISPINSTSQPWRE
jgi:hypothetical protein